MHKHFYISLTLVLLLPFLLHMRREMAVCYVPSLFPVAKLSTKAYDNMCLSNQLTVDAFAGNTL